MQINKGLMKSNTFRQKDQQPIIDTLKKLLFDHTNKPKTPYKLRLSMPKILGYLRTYLSNGYDEISNNISDLAVRTFVINRKVLLISVSYDGVMDRLYLVGYN